MSKSLYTLLFVVFLDYLGMGLVYPLFSSMLFDPSCPLVDASTSTTARGIYLGFLLACMPLAQFVTSPIWGAISDAQGRKKPLEWSLFLSLFGYFIACLGIIYCNFFLLIISRILIGSASGNIAIVQAAIADLSAPKQKTKHFGLYNMAWGAGFCIGPLCSHLSIFGLAVPFLAALALTSVNFLFTHFFFIETHFDKRPTPFSLTLGLSQIKQAFLLKSVRLLFLCSFLNYFGWSYFYDLSPVFLLARFGFSVSDLGFFFGISGAVYGLSSGYLTRPLIKRYSAKILFCLGLFLSALLLMPIPFLSSSIWIWPFILLFSYTTALVCPTSTALISNESPKDMQGEVLGILSSVNAAGLILSPLLAGSFVGNYPTSPIWVGSFTLLFAAVLYFFLGLKKQKKTT